MRNRLKTANAAYSTDPLPLDASEPSDFYQYGTGNNAETDDD